MKKKATKKQTPASTKGKGRKSNGLLGRVARSVGERVVKSARASRAVSKAGRAYKSELKLEAKLRRQRQRREEAETAARRSVRKAAKPRRERNVAKGFVDANGIFHPIRASHDYNEFQGGDFEPRSRKLTPENMTLTQFVRSERGIKFRDDHALAGELRHLKESGARGIVMKSGRKYPEAMAEAAREAGFKVPKGEAAFLEVLAADASGQKVVRHPEFYSEQGWKARRDNPAATRRRRTASTPLFDHAFARAAAESKARVRRVHYAGNDGTVIGENQGWLRVRWDGNSKTALIRPDNVTYLNPSTKKAAKKAAKKSAKKAAKKASKKPAARPTSSPKQQSAGKARAKRAPRPRGRFDRDGRRKNPDGAPPEVEKLIREFLGKEPTGKTLELYVPQGQPKDFAIIGPVEDITFDDGRVLSLRGKGAWLGQAEVDGRRRVFIGLSQPFERFRNGEPVKATHLGVMRSVAYWAAKPHIEGDNRVRCYEHLWGDEGGRRPSARLTAGGRLAVVGGDYTTAKEGIRN